MGGWLGEGVPMWVACLYITPLAPGLGQSNVRGKSGVWTWFSRDLHYGRDSEGSRIQGMDATKEISSLNP